MRNAAKALLSLLLFGAAAWIGATVLWPAVLGPKKQAPAAPAAPTLPADLVRRMKAASGSELSAVLERYSGHPQEDQVQRLARSRAAVARTAIQTRLDALLAEFRYASAADMLATARREWAGLSPARLAVRELAELREEQETLVRGRKQEAEAMLRADRHEAARETLKTEWELEPAYRKALEEHLADVEHRIQTVAPTPTNRPPKPIRERPLPVVQTGLSPVPALPGYPHPDVKRIAEARATVARAKSLFAKGRHEATIETIDQLFGYYGDLAYVKRNHDAADAMMLLSRYKARRSPAAFFHATSVKSKGRRITLRYEFKSDGEYADWAEERTLPYQTSGEFGPARGGVRGTGGMSYLLRGFFENDVQLRCSAKIQKPKSHGLLFCQNGNELRQLMLLVANHKIVEGENYVKARPGHSVLMFGKGTNNDVPLDSPYLGFIFKGASKTKPGLPPNATATLTFSVKRDQMVGTVNYRGDSCMLTYHTKGDDGRSIERLRPGVFVIEAGVVFSEIVIKGTLHRQFEKRRVEELLDQVATLED